MDEQIRRCPCCGRELAPNETVCPVCSGEADLIKKRKVKKWIAWILVILAAALLLVLGLSIYGHVTEGIAYREKIQELIREPEVEIVYMDTTAQLDALEPDALWRDPEAILADHPELTEDQQKAVRYLCDGYFDEGYSEDRCYYYMDMNNLSEADTRKAIACCQVDFNAQALRRALMLLGEDEYGRISLADRLEDDMFTPEQVQYAVENCGADWDYQAELAVRSYVYHIPISREGLVRIMLSDGYDPVTVIRELDEQDPDWNREALQQAVDLLQNSDYDPDRKVDELFEDMLFWGFTPAQSKYAIDILID